MYVEIWFFLIYVTPESLYRLCCLGAVLCLVAGKWWLIWSEKFLNKIVLHFITWWWYNLTYSATTCRWSLVTYFSNMVWLDSACMSYTTGEKSLSLRLYDFQLRKRSTISLKKNFSLKRVHHLSASNGITALELWELHTRVPRVI